METSFIVQQAGWAEGSKLLQKYIFLGLHLASAASKLRDIEFPLQRRNIKIQATVTKEEAPRPPKF